MDLITINKEQLKKLFVEAYEAGWYGSKELAGSTADDLVKKEMNIQRVMSEVNIPKHITPQCIGGKKSCELICPKRSCGSSMLRHQPSL
jgi:hypothetical protein